MYRHLFPRLLLAVAVSVVLCSSSSLFAQNYGDLPLSFEPNRGQSDSQVQYLSHGKGYGFFLSADGATLQLGSTNPRTIQLSVANGQRPSRVAGEQPLPGAVNYLFGTDPTQWLRNLPTFARVRMSNVYPGVDLVYYGNHRQLEYDVVVHPGAQASQVALIENGADQLQPTTDGGLVMHAGSASLKWHAPVAYQQIDGQRYAVTAKYEIAGSTIRFAVGDYDHAHDLVIDPVLIYSTYLGGNGGEVGDVGNAIAVDTAGNAYVAGLAASTNFPTTSTAMQTATRGDDDAFVAKLNPQGTAFVYSTYLGGGGQDIAWGVAVNSAGEAFVAGQTGSGLNGTSPFPTTAGAYQRSQHLGTLNNSVFVAKLSVDGNDLLYSTLLSGSNDSFAAGIAIDPNGNAYVLTNTADGFPVTSNAYQKSAGTHGCPYQQFADGQAQVVTKLNPTGSALEYSTYVGHGCDYGAGIAVNSAGEAHITGYTEDGAYPVTTGALQTKFGGVVDAFVTKLNVTGGGLVYSTLLGGSLADFASSIALDSSGNAYVTGGTDGYFPTTAGAYEPTATNNGYRKGFITKISPLGKSLVYSTYVRGATNVYFNSIAVDSSHNAYVTGYTDGKQYPVTSTADQGICYANANGCMTQAVVTKLNATGTGLLYSSYFGASDASNNYFPGNIGNAIAVDTAGGFYITGRTSAGLKTTANSVEPSYRSTSNSSDAFVAKFNVYGTAASATQVKIASPKSSSTVSSSVKVEASASGVTVGWMQVYVDGVRKVQVSGSTVNANLNLAVGQRRITVQAINKDSSTAKSTIYVTVK
jgi:hypothetical protein